MVPGNIIRMAIDKTSSLLFRLRAKIFDRH